MADVVINFKANTDAARADIGKAQDSLEDFGNAGKKAGLSLTDLRSGIEIAEKAFGYLKQAFDATVKVAAEWGDTMGDLAQLTGASVRDTSLMAATFELMGVEIGTLESALKAMTKNGMQLNLDTLKKLATQYQAIQDPVKQNEFLFKNFGKAGLEMAEIMGRSADELDKLGAAAARSGKVIDEQAAQAAEDFNVQMEIFQQNTEGAAISLGTALIPWLNKAIDGGENWVKVMGAINLVIQKQTGIIDEDQAALRAAALAAGDIAAVYTEQFDPAVMNTTDAIDRQNERLTALNASVTTTTPNIAAIKAETARWEAATKYAADEIERAALKEKMAIDLLSAAMGGAVANENEAYTDSQNELAAKMAEVRNEIDKLAVSNGQYVSYTEDAKYTAEEYQLQLEKVTKAQTALSENTDDSKTLALTVALQNATEKANGMAAGLGGVSSYMVDNGEKILTLNSEYNELSNQFNANAAAHEEATARIVFGMLQQQLAMDGLSKEEVAFLTDVGEEWGIYDEKTAAVMRAVQDSITEHGLNSKAVLDELAKSVNDLPETKTITITTIRQQIDQEMQGATGTQGGQHGGATGDGYASGGDFIVPPGYPNDSYRIGVQSGERVIVVPREQVNNYSLTVNSPAATNVGLEFGRARALAGAF